MTDRLGEALADLEANFDVFAAEMGVARAGALLAAARNWDALTNPSPDLIRRLAAVLDGFDEKYGNPPNKFRAQAVVAALTE